MVSEKARGLASSDKMSQMEIHFLGTGGSWPTPERNVTAIAIKLGAEVILLDCGEGTQRQFMSSNASYMQVSKIFISHFHGDHFLGFPAMVQSMTLNDREDTLDVFGPPNTVKLVDQMLHLGYFKPSFEITARDMEAGESIDFGRYKVIGFPVNHSVPTYGFVIEEAMRPGKFNKPRALELGIPEGPLFARLQRGEEVSVNGQVFRPDQVLGPPRRGRKVVYSGDTIPCKELVERARGADVLIHEATLSNELEQMANERGHSSIRQACLAAKEADVKMLILTHISPRYKLDEVDVIKAEAERHFQPVEVAVDLWGYEVKLGD